MFPTTGANTKETPKLKAGYEDTIARTVARALIHKGIKYVVLLS